MPFSKPDLLTLLESLPVLINRNQIQQLRVAGSQPRPGSPLSPNPIASQPSLTVPQHVQSVQATLKRTSDISTKVTVTFKRNPGDPLFVETRVYVSGYKGNPQPVQMGSGQSPVSFSLENTGEPVTVSVQSSGNLGQAPISTAPSTTFQLAKTNLATTPTAAGNGTASSGAAVFGLSNPSWWGSYDGGFYAFGTGTAGKYGTGTANQIKFSMIRIPYSITIRKLATLVNTSVGGGATAAFGIYDTSGNKIFSWDNIAVAASGLQTTTLGSPVTLAPGIYIAATGTVLTTLAASQNGYTAGSSSEGIEPWAANGTKRSGTAANPISGGAMPSTLGALSLGGGNFDTMPYLIMEA